jgi:hypothetical protein
MIMTDERVPQISLICPTARGWENLQRAISTIRTKLDIEIIFVGPRNYIPDPSLIPFPYRFIESKVKPVQCLQIGMVLAKGETVGLFGDDSMFSEFAWDEIYEIYKQSNDYKTIVSMNWWEHRRNYKGLVMFGPIQLPTGCSVMSRKFFMELGGYDKTFIKRQADMDVFIRAVANGAIVKYPEERFLYGVEWPDDNGYQHLFSIDHELYATKWVLEGGKLVQRIPDQFFTFDDSIYTVSQGSRDDRYA